MTTTLSPPRVVPEATTRVRQSLAERVAPYAYIAPFFVLFAIFEIGRAHV